MTAEVDNLYTNLNKLLDDICNFLSDETKFGKLSAQGRRQADMLIARSKIQIQEIEKFSGQFEDKDDCTDYVDMERKPLVDEEKNNIYSFVDETAPNPAAKLKVCPFLDKPVRELHELVKHGPICWKIKIILNFEKLKKIYCGIQSNWLMVYNSERDNKPFQVFDLTICKAKSIDNKPLEFQLKADDKKMHYFVAQTFKDMLQWVAHINRYHEENYRTEEKPELEMDNDVEDEGEAIYDEPAPRPPSKFAANDVQPQPAPEVPPDLPSRRIITKQVTPPSSSESLASYDQVETEKTTTTTSSPPQPPTSDSSVDSFSEEDQDAVYGHFVAVQTTTNNTETTVSVNKPEIKEKPKNHRPLLPRKPSLPNRTSPNHPTYRNNAHAK